MTSSKAMKKREIWSNLLPKSPLEYI